MNYNFKVDSKNNVWPPPSTIVVIQANTHVIDVILKDSQRLDYYNNVIKIDLRQTSNLKWLRLNEVTANQNNQLAISSIALAIPPVERIQTRRRVKTLRREHTISAFKRRLRSIYNTIIMTNPVSPFIHFFLHSCLKLLHSCLVKLQFVIGPSLLSSS